MKAVVGVLRREEEVVEEIVVVEPLLTIDGHITDGCEGRMEEWGQGIMDGGCGGAMTVVVGMGRGREDAGAAGQRRRKRRRRKGSTIIMGRSDHDPWNPNNNHRRLLPGSTATTDLVCGRSPSSLSVMQLREWIRPFRTWFSRPVLEGWRVRLLLIRSTARLVVVVMV